MQNIVSDVELTYKSKVKPADRVRVVSSNESHKVFRSVYDINKIEFKEFFYCMYLNRANRVLGVLLISEGGVSGCTADPKQIFQGALKLNASGIVLCHNHPSGNMTPSPQDNALTARLKTASKVLEIELLDHIILSPDEDVYYSYQDEGNSAIY